MANLHSYSPPFGNIQLNGRIKFSIGYDFTMSEVTIIKVKVNFCIHIVSSQLDILRKVTN